MSQATDDDIAQLRAYFQVYIDKSDLFSNVHIGSIYPVQNDHMTLRSVWVQVSVRIIPRVHEFEVRMPVTDLNGDELWNSSAGPEKMFQMLSNVLAEAIRRNNDEN